MYVYILSEGRPGDPRDWEPLWTVGHYAPDGKWIPESDHEDENAAAARVAWLNGGKREELPERVPIEESPSYRAAMIDAGRGRLLP